MYRREDHLRNKPPLRLHQQPGVYRWGRLRRVHPRVNRLGVQHHCGGEHPLWVVGALSLCCWMLQEQQHRHQQQNQQQQHQLH